MKLEEVKNKIDDYFASTTPEEIIENFEKLGYVFVPFDEIPLHLQVDFQRYLFGKTVTRDKKGNLMVYPHDFKNWFNMKKNFDMH